MRSRSNLAGAVSRRLRPPRPNQAGHDGRMTAGRHLEWDGCWNARDLGGISTADGRQIPGLTTMDVLGCLREGGLSDADVVAVRRRLLDPC